MTHTPKKQYIGDSVYVTYDGYGLMLTTENGYPDDPRNSIYLEPPVWSALVEFIARATGEEEKPHE